MTTYWRRRARAGAVAAVALVSLFAGACGEDNPISPDTLRFGQIGKIVIDMETPVYGGQDPQVGDGRLRQILSWGSTGLWSIQESISYRDLVGDEYFQRHATDLAQSAGAYAEIITQLNETQGVELDVPELPDTLQVPSCGAVSTRVTFTIQDEAKEQMRSWVRCVSGSLGTVRIEGAGPDGAAVRIAQAVRLVRSATLGERWTSTYAGSVAFGTLDRGGDSESSLVAPATITDLATWGSFWILHGGALPVPTVDFDQDMVVVGIAGEREEAGDSLEVRRILRVDNGTRIELVELVPGDFCSPAARTHVPYHIVLAPRMPRPHEFSPIRREEVPCGG